MDLQKISKLCSVFKFCAINTVKIGQTMESAGDTIITYFNENMASAKDPLANKIIQQINNSGFGDVEVTSLSINPFINEKKQFGVEGLLNGKPNNILSSFCFNALPKADIQQKINTGKIIFSKVPTENKYVGWIKLGK